MLFFTFGNKYKNKKEKKLIQENKFNLNHYKKFLNEVSNYSEDLVYFRNLNKSLVMKGNYEFFHHASDYFEELFKAIRNAKKHIFIMSYIIKPGEILQEFLDILIHKAAQGIKIYWLVDDFGSFLVNKNKYFRDLLANGNIEIVFISKVFFPYIHSQNFYRNHQKFYIIDSNIVFAGGCNLSDEYVGLSKKYGDWIDFNYSLIGDAVNSYILLFLRAWTLWGNKNTTLSLNALEFFNKINFDKEKLNANSILTLDSPAYDTSFLEYNLLGLITKAKESIKIVTPYFSVPASLFNALKMMLLSNVEVEIYFPSFPDKKIIWNTSINFLKRLIPFGLKIYLYKDSFIHSKCGLIDNKIAFFGSSNMDMRSMYAQYELMDIIEGEAVEEVVEIISNYKDNSYLYNDKNSKNKNIIKDTFYETIRPLA
ncbi:phospholipase D-like domain-containing protein [Mycoplasmopsis meleagridis]|uniref:phospholipase D-like domain-containing protein n=1 Tax=Mycoplasmopsis meleagridis TaxID=29561 RepID=UPI003A872B63